MPEAQHLSGLRHCGQLLFRRDLGRCRVTLVASRLMSSGGRPLKVDEVEASRLFPLLTGRQCEELDGTSVASGQPDFKLLDSAGIQVGTLEVTQHTDQKAMATAGAANKVDWSLPAGLGTWRLDVEIGAQMGTIMNTVIPIVQQAAAADEDTVTRSGANATAMAPNKILRVRCLDPSGPDEVWPMVSPDGGATSRDVLADVAEQEVAANVSKLGPVSGLERHLLVWLRSTLDTFASVCREASGLLPHPSRWRCSIGLAPPFMKSCTTRLAFAT